MAKKPASFEYNGTLVKVLDGDTIDCYIDLGFDLKIKKRIRYMGIDTWESRTRDLDEKAKGLLAKARNKELLEAGVFKIVSHGTGKFGRVLGEIFVSPDAVGHEVSENVDRSEDGLVSINDILINEGHAYEYGGGKKKDFKAEIAKEKAAKKKDLVDIAGVIKSTGDRYLGKLGNLKTRFKDKKTAKEAGVKFKAKGGLAGRLATRGYGKARR